MAKENRKVKNSVLVDLFYEDEFAEENDRMLYNALHKEPLPEGTEIRKIRVDNVLYMNFQNDFSFGVGGKVLILGEHQSTINKNMPLRNLMYTGRAYEQMVPVRKRYKKEIIRLPKPEFYTFYNGKETKVININPDAGHEILEKCPVLKEYGQFIDMIRKYQETGDEDAYEHAIKECIQKGILADYLTKRGSEVVNMLVAEYDYKMDMEVQKEEAFEEGEKLGRLEGQDDGKMMKLVHQVVKKIQKGISEEQTAEMLEEAFDTIHRIYDMAGEFAPEYDVERIYERLKQSF